MKEFPNDVSVTIVAFNALKRLPSTVEALISAGCPPGRITVVDNGSTDGCAEWVQTCWPAICVRRLDVNNGPNPGRNAGLKNARTPYVLLLDDDILVEKETIHTLHCFITSSPEIAITSPMILHGDQPDLILYAGTGLHFMCEAVNPWQGRRVEEYENRPQEIGCAPGGAMLVSRSAALRVDLFDENYFIGKADGDFSQRIRLAGYKIVGVPEARALHTGTARGTHRYYYQIRNRWYFMLKNYQLQTLLLLLPALLVHEVLQLAILALKGHTATYFKAMLGLFAMLPKIPEERAKIAKYRVVKDREVLQTGPVLVPEDILSQRYVRKGKAVYDKLLQSYWNFLTKVVLKGARQSSLRTATSSK